MSLLDRYPKLAKNTLKLAATALIVYCALASVMQTLTDAQQDGCDRANDRQLNTYMELRADAGDARALAGQTRDPEIATVYGDQAERKDDRADDMLVSANETGFQDDPGSPTISCNDAYPQALPWPR